MAAATSAVSYENELKVMKATELRLGLPGTDSNFNNKRPMSVVEQTEAAATPLTPKSDQETTPPPSKAQIVGWPPIRSYRKNNMMKLKSSEYVKVSMDGAPYLRKIDLNNYNGYPELLKALEEMFKFTINGHYCEREGYRGSDYAPTYEDKDGDWMLVGDVPWEMFINSCKRLRIMKGAAPSSELPISSGRLVSHHHAINQAR